MSAAVMARDSTTGGFDPVAFIMMSNAPNLCDELAANSHPPDLHAVIISLFVFSGSGTALPAAPGTFTISTPSNVASMQGLYSDAMCKDVPANDATATAGTVNLVALHGDVFAGTFSLTLDSGDHVSGSFDPIACPALQNFVTPPGPPVCN